MKNIKIRIKEMVREAFNKLPGYENMEEKEISIMPASRPEFGDFYTNAALKAAKERNASPQKLASDLCGKLAEMKPDFLAKAEVKNGFINFFVNNSVYFDFIKNVHESSGSVLQMPCAGEKKVLIEFVSANPTGPLTIAHGRQAAFGEALARILKYAGFEVVKEYYLNDAGRQIKLLGQSLKARYMQLNGKEASIPEEGYEGEYLIELAKKLKEFREQEDVFFDRFASESILGGIKEDLRAFGVTFDSWINETSFIREGSVNRLIEELKKKGLLYLSDSSWWFKSSAYGDEKDRVVIKSDGSLTYLATDIAYHENKIKRGFDTLVNIIGPDHHGYIPRLKAAVEVLGGNPENFTPIIVQLTTLYRGKEKLSMSTRKGQFISLRQLIDEVGPDASKFFFIFRKTDSHLDFDLELAKKKSLENPVYYLQYAYVRMKHILKFAEEKGMDFSGMKPDFSLLKEEEEIIIAKKVAGFSGIVESVVQTYGVHLLAEYLLELSRAVHSYYQKHRVVNEGEKDITFARLVLINALFEVFSRSLELLNISLPDSM
ncbi:MAG TPA: arginine--tRNA ligase [bacterium]|nr:arginine--tRNA ligase [bacterium]